MQSQDQLFLICAHFLESECIKRIEPLTSGHINDTYHIVSEKDEYVLQRLNTHVFNNYISLIQNKVTISNYIKKFYNKNGSPYKTITVIKTKGDSFYLENNDSIWILMHYIRESQVFYKAPNKDVVFEAGKLYGNFTYATTSVDCSKISEILPDFHSVPLRLKQFEKALKLASNKRRKASQSWIDLINNYRRSMCELWKLKENNTLPRRITHNDTKLSNILFSKTDPVKGLAVIDLDTVMPGLVHFDFGDSIRSICSTATEDDDNLNKVSINLDYYNAFCMGYANETKNILTPLEISYLPLGVQTLIFIMGLRFLTDFLNNDTYYKTDYQLHNLVRASNQFTLFNSVIENLDSIKTITKQNFQL
ncbi:phosphotransferase enzyme family protein [Hanstruepera marina]|uniref:phosphotransferase enzyme family protein n=1 Tax=Hanstruepera marina TaxID=2873265 RepID=UPI001CA65190|nr:aminoglycoside phosphotransferase family protein [Hanstruepera marina]